MRNTIAEASRVSLRPVSRGLGCKGVVERTAPRCSNTNEVETGAMAVVLIDANALLTANDRRKQRSTDAAQSTLNADIGDNGPKRCKGVVREMNVRALTNNSSLIVSSHLRRRRPGAASNLKPPACRGAVGTRLAPRLMIPTSATMRHIPWDRDGATRVTWTADAKENLIRTARPLHSEDSGRLSGMDSI